MHSLKKAPSPGERYQPEYEDRSMRRDSARSCDGVRFRFAGESAAFTGVNAAGTVHKRRCDAASDSIRPRHASSYREGC